MSTSATKTPSRIVWFELPAGDPQRAQAFYGRLFGWSFQPFGEEEYHMTYEGGGAIMGVPDQSGLMAYFGVEDVDAALAQVREFGGEAGEKQEISGVGLYARCTDTEGNAFGLYQDLSA
ncbi:MAG: VOC family protein [Chloroflexota bacterium]|nr:VOC family protein [Chloroflexota bacterium]